DSELPSDEEFPSEETETQTESDEVSFANSDNTLTVVGWNYEQGMFTDYYKEFCAPSDLNVEFHSLDCIGYDTPEAITSYINSGSDMDLFFVEPDWMWSVAGDNGLAMPLSELGITEADYADAYPYTVEIGKNTDGVLMAAAPEICPGYYAFNCDLAFEYLGVATAKEMQEKVSDWDKFEATAEELKQASGGKVTMCATLDGLWKAFSTNTDYRWFNNGEIQTDQAQAFLTMARRFADNGYVDPNINQWTDDWFDLSQSQDNLGFFYTTWMLHPSGSYAFNNGEWSIVKGPDSFFWGGTWLCVASACDTKGAAADFLRTFTTNPETMHDFMNAQSFVADDGFYVCNNQKVVQSMVGSNVLLDGQDPYPVLDEVALGIRWDASKTTPYDLEIRNYLPYSYGIRFDEPDCEMLDYFADIVNSLHPELAE
ncbi:MAG: extracellular solute-binding protein, partial [Oscillospiraceae bacterium]|nr:extracellular solute-binding protein [Oscillospiraceae bacterium]